MPDPLIAYCGPAAIPDDLWTRWNGDPLMLATLAGLALAVGRGHSCRCPGRLGSDRADVRRLRLAALRARLGAVLGAGAAPCPAGRRRCAAAGTGLSPAALGSPPLAALVGANAVVLWLWHAPGLYAWGLASVPAYWLMQATLLGSAWLLWRAILAPATDSRARR